MRLKSVNTKSNKKAQGGTFFTLKNIIIMLLILGIAIYFLFFKVQPAAEGMIDCKFQQGDCYSSCEGSHAYQVFGATGCKETEVCCRGKMLSDVEGDGSSSGDLNNQNACSNYEICYISENTDTNVWQVANKWHPGSDQKNCFYLYPLFDNKNEEVKATNGQVLFKGYEKVKLIASAKAKCCRMQIGGISTVSANTFPYFPSGGSKEVTDYIHMNETTGVCTANLSFDFTSYGSIFDPVVWDKSYDSRENQCNIEGPNGPKTLSPNKAMFKVDFVYWNEECAEDGKSGPGYLAPSANSISTLFDVAKFDPDRYGYNDDSNNNPATEEDNYLVYLRLTTRTRLGPNKDNPVCSVFCESLDRSTAAINSQGKGDPCDFVSFVEVDAREDCPARKFEQVSKKKDLFYKQFYDGFKFVDEGSKITGYYPVSPNKKICLIGASGSEFYSAEFASGSCSGIYYINPKKDTPTEPCEVQDCSEMRSEGACNEIQDVLSNDHYLSLYSDEYCDDLNCYYGKDGWISSNKCRSCGVISKCSNYNKEAACTANPCSLGINPTLTTAGCFWSTKGRDNCKQCPGSCAMLDNEKDCGQSIDCNLFCTWDPGSNSCINENPLSDPLYNNLV